MKVNLRTLITIIILAVAHIFCGGIAARIAILDITGRNNENEISGAYSRQVYSATYLCDISGYDYILTDDLEKAMDEDLILFANMLTATSFNCDEMISLSEWVKAGGTIVVPGIRSVPTGCTAIVSELFGIDGTQNTTKKSNRTIINWNPDFFDDRELEYIDEEHERATSVDNVNSYAFIPTTSDVLAHYDSGEAAVARNAYGDGYSYLSGISWRDVVQRNQLNKDQHSSREYNNGFEPSSDVWAFFLRSIYAKTHAVSLWKFTVPAGYTQLLVPTHDCDSRTAYDEMHFMSEYEKSLGLSGHYFLTAHYYSDKENFGHSYLSAFYNSETIPNALQLLSDGHTVGSHSLCHFPDFNKTRNTDIVSREEYALRATCVDGTSTGASTWAEIVMSKQILQEDLGNRIRSFRSGHLCVNPDFHAMMEAGDYEFQSCYTGGDLLSEFPFFGRFKNDWSGDQTKVLTMPLHISDVYNNKDGVPLNNDTWETHPAPDHWEAAMQKLRGNYASAILLIHPNREWKMTLQKRLIERLDTTEVGLYNFEDYGDFWNSRLKTEYTYTYDEQAAIITVTTDIDSLRRSRMTFGVEISDVPVNSVVISNQDGSQLIPANLKRLSDTRYLAVPDFTDIEIGSVHTIDYGLDSSLQSAENAVFDINGRHIKNLSEESKDLSVLPKGIYILRRNGTTRKIRI